MDDSELAAALMIVDPRGQKLIRFVALNEKREQASTDVCAGCDQRPARIGHAKYRHPRTHVTHVSLVQPTWHSLSDRMSAVHDGSARGCAREGSATSGVVLQRRVHELSCHEARSLRSFCVRGTNLLVRFRIHVCFACNFRFATCDPLQQCFGPHRGRGHLSLSMFLQLWTTTRRVMPSHVKSCQAVPSRAKP